MITKKQKDGLIELIGHRYTPIVQQRLEEKEITNKDGQPHTRSYITNVMNGLSSNKEIEATIYELAKEAKERKQKQEEILN